MTTNTLSIHVSLGDNQSFTKEVKVPFGTETFFWFSLRQKIQRTYWEDADIRLNRILFTLVGSSPETVVLEDFAVSNKDPDTHRYSIVDTIEKVEASELEYQNAISSI